MGMRNKQIINNAVYKAIKRDPRNKKLTKFQISQLRKVEFLILYVLQNVKNYVLLKGFFKISKFCRDKLCFKI